MGGMSIETQEDLDALRRVGRVVAETIAAARARLCPGMTTAELDGIGEEVFARHGACSAPRYAYDFPGCLCLSVNDEAVHGIPGERVLRPGDLVKVDVTAELGGYIADACESIPVGAVDRQTERLRAAADAALRRGIAVATAGARVRDVGAAVERVVEALDDDRADHRRRRPRHRGRRRLDVPDARRRALRPRGAHDRRDARSAARAHRGLSRPGADRISSAKAHQTATHAGQK
jgi:methionine aminopeptidase